MERRREQAEAMPTASMGATEREERGAGTEEPAAMESEPAAETEASTTVALRYSVDLKDSFGAVCHKAKSGVQSCQAIAAFVQERANMEALYARSMLKVAQNAKTEDWAPGVSNCWVTVQETLEAIAKEHADCASRMQTGMVAGAKAFAAQQELQVQRLIAEGTKFRAAQQHVLTVVERAKDKYDRRYAEAREIKLSLRRADTGDVLATNGNTESGVEDSRELPEKGSAGQLLTKMWDTTSSFAKPSIERQRSKLDGCMEEVFAAERVYVQTVEDVNIQLVALDREVTGNLHAFQLTEEQRIDYLKDVLVRTQKMFLDALEGSQKAVERLKQNTSSIDEFEDIEEGFRNLNGILNPDTQILKPEENAFYQRMMQIQSMSDRGHQSLKIICTTITDLIGIEDQFTASIMRLLRSHDAQDITSFSAGELFNLSNTTSQVCEEGDSMNMGWTSTKDHVQRLAEIHQEFRSLLAEPVALSISTMQHEYGSARSAIQENFSKSHSALCHDSAIYHKYKKKQDIKRRECGILFSALQGMNTADMSNSDADHVLDLLRQLSLSLSDKDKKTETKLKLLAEDLRGIQRRFAESEAALQQRSGAYIQDIDVFISFYMKNEKHRLQVEKSSLQSLAKAFDLLLVGEITVASKSLQLLEVIDSSTDVENFIIKHQKPVHQETETKVTPIFHDGLGLKAAREQYCSSPKETQGSKVLSINTRDPQLPSIDGTTSSPIRRPSSVSMAQLSPTQYRQGSASTGLGDETREFLSLGTTDFQKKFKLESPEQVVESYSGALFTNNFPNHGRIYLTSGHLCFNGWRDTIHVISYSDIITVEKKNSALIVPNAIEVTVSNGDKAFFTSMVFRDECYQSLQQLQAIQKATVAAMASNGEPSVQLAESEHTTPDPASPTNQAPITPSSQEAISSPRRVDPSGPIIPVNSLQIPPAKDTCLHEFEVVLNEELPFSVNFAFSNLWIESDTFFRSFLVSGGETNVDISQWSSEPVTYTAVDSPDTFNGSRRVTYNHNKKYMVGPSCVPTVQTQRYKWEPSAQLVISVTTIVSDVPYCDYFRAENRWVFSATGKADVCSLQVGIRMQWVKSTWLKKQIESTAMAEAKEYTKSLVTAAITSSKQRQNVAMGIPSDSSDDPSLKNGTSSTGNADAPTDQSASIKANISATESTRDASNLFVSQSQTQAALLLHAAHWICIVLFIFTMLRVWAMTEQMLVISKESLMQQQQQHELFREVLLGLYAREVDVPPE